MFRSARALSRSIRVTAPSPIITRAASTISAPIFPAKYGGKYEVTLIPGDGIGQETARALKALFKYENVPIDFEEIDVHGIGDEPGARELFAQSIESLKRNRVGLKGILYTPLERSGHQSWNVALRQGLDIYASVILIKNIPGYKTRHANVDFAIIRENTEGEYSGLEHQSVPGVVEALKIVTRAKSERIARFAFDFAQKNHRKKVTCIHKANIMKLSDGLFRGVCSEIGKKEYPQIEFNDLIVDNATMQAVSKPQQFDVLVVPNLYGSILSNVGAGLVGGPGVIPSANVGREFAVFEPGCRHVGLDIAGKGQANPTGLILSACMMLRHLGLDHYANRLSTATYNVLAEGKTLTRDLKGTASTGEFTRAILNALETVKVEVEQQG